MNQSKKEFMELVKKSSANYCVDSPEFPTASKAFVECFENGALFAYDLLYPTLDLERRYNDTLKHMIKECVKEFGVIGGMTTDIKTTEFINRDGGVVDIMIKIFKEEFNEK